MGRADTTLEDFSPASPPLLGAFAFPSRALPSDVGLCLSSGRGSRGDRGCLRWRGGREGNCWKARSDLDRSAVESDRKAVSSHRQRGSSGVAEGVNGSGVQRAPSPAADRSYCCWGHLTTTASAAAQLAGGCSEPGPARRAAASPRPQSPWPRSQLRPAAPPSRPEGAI